MMDVRGWLGGSTVVRMQHPKWGIYDIESWCVGAVDDVWVSVHEVTGPSVFATGMERNGHLKPVIEQLSGVICSFNDGAWSLNREKGSSKRIIGQRNLEAITVTTWGQDFPESPGCHNEVNFQFKKSTSQWMLAIQSPGLSATFELCNTRVRVCMQRANVS
ncbi:hypothetical protein Pelo_16321 [Pelomyxa schiedti]|nr:hypothetical protein Pelo_16321 [Pelomyxa schiedti]